MYDMEKMFPCADCAHKADCPMELTGPGEKSVKDIAVEEILEKMKG